MKKIKMILLTGIVALGGFAGGYAINNSKTNCQFCGELFNNRDTVLKEMCDICFGWREYEARNVNENGVLATFEDGTGYYFSPDGE